MARVCSMMSMFRTVLARSLALLVLLLPASSQAQEGFNVGVRFGPNLVDMYDPRSDSDIVGTYFSAGMIGRYLFVLEPGEWLAGFETGIFIKETPSGTRNGAISDTEMAAMIPLLGVLQHDFEHVHVRVLVGGTTGFSRADFISFLGGLGFEIPLDGASVGLDYLYQDHLFTFESSDGAGAYGVTHHLLLGFFL